jgi:hypothetical protein
MSLDAPGSLAEPQSARRQGVSWVLGMVFVVIGGVAFVSTLTGNWMSRWLFSESGWPLIIVGAGVFLLLMMFAGGRTAAWLAIPASLTTATGVVLWAMNVTEQWQTMAYAWALIAPTGVGLGIWLQGVWAGQTPMIADGQRVAAIGLALFVGFAFVFEVLIDLSGLMVSDAVRSAAPVLLIALGVVFLMRAGVGSATERQ